MKRGLNKYINKFYTKFLSIDLHISSKKKSEVRRGGKVKLPRKDFGTSGYRTFVQRRPRAPPFRYFWIGFVNFDSITRINFH